MEEHSEYGLPLKVSRHWVEEHSEPDEFGAVPLPSQNRAPQDIFTHAIYAVECTCESITVDCPCSEDPGATWELMEYSG